MIDMHAKYTMVLKSLLDIPPGKEAIDKAMSTYPLYISTSNHDNGIPNIIPTREQLNRKILNYYKYREIGFETFGRFLDELQTALEEIMPYYNQLFFSADQDYNIIYNVDYKKTINTQRAGENSSVMNSSEAGQSSTTGTSDTTTSGGSETDSNVSNNAKTVETDTPQSEISVHLDNINSVDYASKAGWNASEGSDHAESTEHGTANTESESNTTDSRTNEANASGTNSETESILETTKGNFGVTSAQDLIAKYRDIIINIEQQIINDARIAELFMLVY